MTNIPAGTKFHGVAASVPTADKKSAMLNALSDSYSIEDIASSVVAGNTTEIQYNLNGELSADPNLTKSPEHFFAISEIGDKFLVQGSGDWSNTGLFSELVGHLYSNGDITASMLSGDLTGVGLAGEGNALVISDDATGKGSLLHMKTDLISINSNGPITNGSIGTTEGESSMSLEDSTGLVYQYSIKATPNGIQINSLSGSYILPAVDGTAGQVLSTDGNGNLSWVTP